MNTTAVTNSASPLSLKAMLVSLKITEFSARKTDKAVTDEINQNKNASKDAGRYSKQLIPKKHLKSLISVRSEARAFHSENTLPWGDGVRILPASNYWEYTKTMQDIKARFEAEADKFCKLYPALRAEAKEMLGDMYADEDYPPSVEDRFSFDVAIMPLPDVNDFRIELGTEEQERIKTDIQARLHDAQVEATRDLWNRLHEIIKKASDKLNSDGSIFRDSLIGNISELVELLPRLNVTNDKELNEAAQKIKAELTVHTPEEIRKDAQLRKDVARKADDILEAMSGYIG